MASCELIWPIHLVANYIFHCYLTSQSKLPYLTLLLWKEDIRLRTMTPLLRSSTVSCIVWWLSHFSHPFSAYDSQICSEYLAHKNCPTPDIFTFFGWFAKKVVVKLGFKIGHFWPFKNFLTGFTKQLFYWTSN